MVGIELKKKPTKYQELPAGAIDYAPDITEALEVLPEKLSPDEIKEHEALTKACRRTIVELTRNAGS